MLTDSRLYPRVETDLAVKVGIPGDNTGARIINISLGGIAVQGNQDLERFLRMENVDEKANTEHLVNFSMLGADLSEVCRLVHVRRLSQERYEFGLKFINLNPQDMEVIADYVDSHVRG